MKVCRLLKTLSVECDFAMCKVEFVVIIKFYIKTFKFESSKFSQINSQMYLYSF